MLIHPNYPNKIRIHPKSIILSLHILIMISGMFLVLTGPTVIGYCIPDLGVDCVDDARPSHRSCQPRRWPNSSETRRTAIEWAMRSVTILYVYIYIYIYIIYIYIIYYIYIYYIYILYYIILYICIYSIMFDDIHFMLMHTYKHTC